MTIAEVIRAVDGLKANHFSGAQKVGWLSECDSNIWKNIIETHEKVEVMPDVFYGYTEDKDMGSKLLVPAPHDVIYRYYLEMMIDLYNKDINSYQNTSRLYNSAYQEYASWYNKNYMPRQTVTHFIL